MSNRVRIVIIASLIGLLFAACQSTGGGSYATDRSASDPAASPSAAALRARELITGESSSSGTASGAAATASASPTPAPRVDTVSAADVADSTPTPEEAKFLDNYLNGLKYMVYFEEGGTTNPAYGKTAVATANRYLIEQLKVQTVDMETIEKKKADERSAWQTETGQSVDFIQFIAQKLNADVYLALSLRITEESAGSKYYSTVTVSAKFYNASTAEMLGSFEMPSNRVMSPASQDQANTMAINATVWMAMARITSQAKELLRTAWKDGIRYDIVMQSTADAKAVGQLKRELGRKFRRVTQESYSAQETRLSVYTFKRADAIEEVIYGAAEAVGMRDLYLLYQRGKSFVFNTGL